MPLEFSTWTNEYVPGPFWQGMIDWADQTKPVEEILADIQAPANRSTLSKPNDRAIGEPAASHHRLGNNTVRQKQASSLMHGSYSTLIPPKLPMVR